MKFVHSFKSFNLYSFFFSVDGGGGLKCEHVSSDESNSCGIQGNDSIGTTHL